MIAIFLLALLSVRVKPLYAVEIYTETLAMIVHNWGSNILFCVLQLEQGRFFSEFQIKIRYCSLQNYSFEVFLFMDVLMKTSILVQVGKTPPASSFEVSV